MNADLFYRQSIRRLVLLVETRMYNSSHPLVYSCQSCQFIAKVLSLRFIFNAYKVHFVI